MGLEIEGATSVTVAVGDGRRRGNGEQRERGKDENGSEPTHLPTSSGWTARPYRPVKAGM